MIRTGRDQKQLIIHNSLESLDFLYRLGKLLPIMKEIRKQKARKKAPGKSFRMGLSLIEIMRMLPDDATAEKWFIETRWPNGVACTKCGSLDVCERKKKAGKPKAYRCRDCRNDFSVKTETLMHNSPLGFQVWAIAIYLLVTNLKGVSSMKLHRDLGISQKSAWHLAHRIRETWKDNRGDEFTGPVEVDETFMGGKEKNKHEDKRSHTRGPSGKTVVVGMKDRETNKVVAKPVPERTKEELHGFISSKVAPEAKVYTDDHRSYIGLPYNHESVNHSIGEYVKEQAHTNGVESFWALLKRGYYGTYHRISEKHLERYVNEFSGRHNDRPSDTIDQQMRAIAANLNGKRLPYQDLIL